VKRAEEIRTRMAAIRSDLDALEAIEDPSDDDHVRLDGLLGEWDDLKVELEPLAERESRVAAVRSQAASAGNVEPPTGDGLSDQGRHGPDLHVRNRRDPFADLDSVRTHLVSPTELRGRADLAIEAFAKRQDHWQLTDDAAEHVTELVHKRGKRFGAALAEQLLVTGSPEYLAAFEQYMSDPGGFSTRAALSLTPANGGYLVPFTLDPTIVLTNNGSANPYRQVATIKTTTTNDWNGVTSAGVSAEWTAEGIEAADATPTVGQLKITPQKADAYLFGSFEVLSDSDIAQQLPDLLADAKDRIEETAFAVGTGSGQPWGVMARGTTLSIAGNAATGPRNSDVYSLMSALPARWRSPRSRPVWMANLTTINALRNVPAFTGATTSIVNDTNPNGPTMLGKPLLESTSIVGTFATTNKVLAFLDASQYYIVDRVGMSILYDPVVLGANRRPTGQGAWYAFWRTGADVSVATAVRVLSLLT
jgi:HK97 family phage major capsid protein